MCRTSSWLLLCPTRQLYQPHFQLELWNCSIHPTRNCSQVSRLCPCNRQYMLHSQLSPLCRNSRLFMFSSQLLPHCRLNRLFTFSPNQICTIPSRCNCQISHPRANNILKISTCKLPNSNMANRGPNCRTCLGRQPNLPLM